MNTTYKEQINTIQQVREIISKGLDSFNNSISNRNAALHQQIELSPILKISDAALNDAASTIAAINLTPTLQEHQILIDLLKKVFLGKGTVDLDVELLQQINDLVNPE